MVCALLIAAFYKVAAAGYAIISRVKNILLTLVLAGAALALGLGLWFWQQDRAGSMDLAAATRLDTPRALPALQLQDQHGAAFGRGDLEGRWHLLFFGFTHCPDICPNTLGLLRQVRQELNEPKLRIVFVSLDPQRDTPARLRDYVSYFDPDFLAVTGPEAELQKLTSALYLPYQATAPDSQGSYNVDHSASLVLLNPAAEVVAYFSAPHEPGLLVADLKKLLAQ